MISAEAHYWTKTLSLPGQEPYTSTAVVDVEGGVVVVTYELLAHMLADLGFVETEAPA